MATIINKKASPKPLPMKLAPKPLPQATLDADDNPEAGEEPVQLTAKAPVSKAGVVKPPKVPKEYGDDGSAVEDAPKYTASQPTATVAKKFKDGTETEDKEPVGPIKSFASQPSVVQLSMAVTRNLGNYESVKMMVSLSMPCENTEQGREDAYNEVKGWVDTRVELLNQEVNDQLS